MGTETKIVKNPKNSCKLGQGAPCCIYLTCGADGFECKKGIDGAIEKELNKRLHNGTSNAKGTEDWEECEWH